LNDLSALPFVGAVLASLNVFGISAGPLTTVAYDDISILIPRNVGPICDNHMSQSIFTLGQNVIADSVRVVNSGDSQRVEFKYWTVWPDGATSPRYTSKSRGEFVPSGFDREYGPVRLFKVRSDTPVGAYQYNCRVLDPGTGETLHLDVNPFEVQ
jgi:hypothetical protein